MCSGSGVAASEDSETLNPKPTGETRSSLRGSVCSVSGFFML